MAKNEKNEEPDFNKPPRAPHSCHAYQLMEHAEAMLEEGDRLQASEKAWGAYVHQMKALAEAKGWLYRSTGDLDELNAKAAKLAHEELGEKEGEVLDMANAADTLHKNFYGDVKAIPTIRRNMRRTKDLIDILRRLGGNGNGTPSGNGNGTPSGNGNGTPSGNGNGTPSGSGNDAGSEEGSSQPPPSPSARRNGAASVGKSHLTPQMSPHMRQAKKLRKKFSERIGEETSMPRLTENNFAFMSQAEFDALKNFR